MSHFERMEQALQAPDSAGALRSLVQELSHEGLERQPLYDLFHTFLLSLRRGDKSREKDEELVMDLMDALLGWCHPGARLLADK